MSPRWRRIFVRAQLALTLLALGCERAPERPAVIEGITQKIRSQADLLDTRLSEDLGKATERLERLSESLAESSSRIRGLGDSLKAGGVALKELQL